MTDPQRSLEVTVDVTILQHPVEKRQTIFFLSRARVRHRVGQRHGDHLGGQQLMPLASYDVITTTLKQPQKPCWQVCVCEDFYNKMNFLVGEK